MLKNKISKRIFAVLMTTVITAGVIGATAVQAYAHNWRAIGDYYEKKYEDIGDAYEDKYEAIGEAYEDKYEAIGNAYEDKYEKVADFWETWANSLANRFRR